MHRSILALALFLQQGLAAYCPPTGTLLPLPQVSKDLDLSNLTSILDGIAANSSALGWNSTTTSFSIQATSLDETFFSHYHTAPEKNETGTQEVGGDTVFRIASVTKVFTVLALLLEKEMGLDDPIGKYVEELDGKEGWEDVTLRLLASQLAAVSRGGNAGDEFVKEELLVPLGYPPLEDSDIPDCGTDPYSGTPCTREEFLQEQVVNTGFTSQVADQAAYSNLAYIILGYALENATGSSYEEVVYRNIIEPLGLSKTGYENPSLDEAIIPVGMNWFGGDFDSFKKTAGLYSTANDMSIFAKAILNSDLLTPAETRGWLKPAVFTGSLTTSVGAPWEIFRPTHLTDQPRPVDHYTKSGDVPGYAAHLILVPEFGLGVTIHTAGSDAYPTVNSLIDVVQEVLVPALDDLARTQANQLYGGDYISTSDEAPATISLTVDDGPGLKISEWTNRDADMLESFAEIFGSSDARIYPTGNGDQWRIVFSDGEADTGETKSSIVAGDCVSWMKVDHMRYGKQPADIFEFQIGEESEIQGVKLPGFRTELKKV